MKNNKLTEISNEELIKNEKKVKGLTLAFAIVLTLLFTVTIYSTLRKGFSALIITPIALLPMLFVSINNWNDLKKEIKDRNL